MIRLALLWHMHQPLYVDPSSGEAILPWVRLHATHAYHDMARVLERHPGVRATVNFVPSLLEQLEGAARGTMPERYLALSRKAAAQLTAEDRRFIVRQFFMVNREHGIRPLPRYEELLRQRGATPDATRFGEQELRDLQVLFNLAWMGFSARREEPAVARLITKGRDFTEEDKTGLLDTQQALLSGLVSRWRALSDRNQVELSTTPYFHPILPLLCDTDAARRAMPTAQLPPRFQHADDAREQVRRGVAKAAQVFGRAPRGMWPAEGSVSPEAAAVIAAEGVEWIATDEGVLARSTPAIKSRGELYQPHELLAGGRGLRLAFRDRFLSDRIGFTYARMPAREAVRDFLGHVRAAGAQAARAGVEHPLVAVVLDGENAWEHFEGQGEAFLVALHEELERAADVTTVTMAEGLAGPARRLDQLHSGSWIESNFRIWIGHPEDNLAWSLLGEVRRQLEEAEAAETDERVLAEARQCLLAAEGSDWFWWYGDDFETDNAAEFDDLFRGLLLKACRLLGREPSARLLGPISAQARQQGRPKPSIRAPTASISPAADGSRHRFHDWMGAGELRPATGHGAMYEASGPVERVLFGADVEHFYARIHLSTHMRDATVIVEAASGERFRVDAAAAPGEPIDLRVRWATLGGVPGGRVAMKLRLAQGGAELETLPRAGWLELDVPAGPSLADWFV